MRKSAILTDIVFVRQDAEKELRSTMALDCRWFFQVTGELQRMPVDSSASIVFSCFFFISAECPSRFFCEICGRIGNEVPRKRAILVAKRWVQLDKKRWGRTSLVFEARDSVPPASAALVGSCPELDAPTRQTKWIARQPKWDYVQSLTCRRQS